MKKALIAFLFCGVLPLAAFAQAGFIQVTAKVVDPQSFPYSNGTVTATLIPNGLNPTVNGVPFSGQLGPALLDLNGVFNMTLADNTLVSPSGTKWNFHICANLSTVQWPVGRGSQCFDVLLTIHGNGTTQDISSNLNAVATSLTNVCPNVNLSSAGCGGSSGQPAPPAHSVQFNEPLGSFDGDANFVYLDTIPQLYLGQPRAASLNAVFSSFVYSVSTIEQLVGIAGGFRPVLNIVGQNETPLALTGGGNAGGDGEDIEIQDFGSPTGDVLNGLAINADVNSTGKLGGLNYINLTGPTTFSATGSPQGPIIGLNIGDFTLNNHANMGITEPIFANGPGTTRTAILGTSPPCNGAGLLLCDYNALFGGGEFEVDGHLSVYGGLISYGKTAVSTSGANPAVVGLNSEVYNVAAVDVDQPGGVNLSPTQLAQPTCTVLPGGGATSYSYKIVLFFESLHTIASATCSTSTGPATISAGTRVTIAITREQGTTRVRLYRTASSGTPATTGLVTDLTLGYPPDSVQDTGVAGGGETPESTNTTGAVIGSVNITEKRYIAGGTPLVGGDFALGAGWGSTAAISAITGTDQAFNFTITTGGSGIAANPTTTLTFHDGAWPNSPIFVCHQTGGNDILADVTFTSGVATTTTLPMIWNGTPTTAKTYIFSCVGMGR